MRTLILDVAVKTQGVGPIEETLKWGQPSYQTAQSKSGSTIRIDARKGGGYALYFHCQSGLVPTFREIYGDRLLFEGNRAILFEADEVPDAALLRHCIAMALTHRLAKRTRRAG